MPLKRPNARILAKSALRLAIDDFYGEQTMEAREAAAQKITMDKILAGTLSFGETFDPDGPDYLPTLVRDEFVRLHGYILITGGSGSHYADDDRNDLADDDFIAAKRAALDDGLINEGWHERYGYDNVHDSHGVPRLSEMSHQTPALARLSYRE